MRPFDKKFVFGSDEDLLAVLIDWYGMECMLKNDFSGLISKWSELWFAKGLMQKSVDIYLHKYQQLLEKYINYEPKSVCDAFALIILYDQIPRNIYRNNEGAYKYDSKTMNIIENYIMNGTFVLLDIVPFNYLLTVAIAVCHSEKKEKMAYFDEIYRVLKYYHYKTTVGITLINAILAIHYNHNMRIDLFGRIPERNKIINRLTTHTEEIFMKNV